MEGVGVAGPFRFRTEPPFRKLAKALGDAGAELTDWRPAWRTFAPEIGPEMARTLDAQGAPLGESWPSSTPRWLARKAKRGGGRVAGVFTGRLRAELASNTARVSIGKRRLRWGPRLARAYVLNFGRSPAFARPFLGFTPRLERALEAVLVARADDVLARAMGGV